jgi:non-specific serine/threonine protein kinase
VSSSAHSTHADPLPAQLTPFIGRELEIDDVAKLLARPDARLVTLTGPGGVGKTRLAIEIARTIADSYSDSIWFVDLSPIRDPEQVIPAIALTFGLPGRFDTLQALLVGLGPRTGGLLLIDNFEQVVASAPSIGSLLKGMPELKMLVTSREPLKIGGEREYPIAPLPLSAATGDLSPEQLGQLDSVRLFANRAQAVSPSFAVTPENSSEVAEICRRLDGLPLAIELAAARVKALPLPVMLDRLEQRLPLLVGDRRDAPERQQTMRDAIAWSYALLPPDEQTLFRRLGVFVGGFTLEAAEAIGAVGGANVDILRTLSSLVDKSLVRLDFAALGGPRYLTLETIREFARELLLHSEECTDVRTAHAAWFTRLAEERQVHGDIWSEPRSSGHATPPVAVDYGNVRAAITWLDESGNLPELARMAGSVYWYWHYNGPRREGLDLLRKASRAKADTARDKESRMWALEGLSIFARNAGHFDEATKAALELHALAQEVGSEIGESVALGCLGYIALAQGDYDRTDSLARRAIEKRNQFSEGWAVAIVVIHLGQAALGRGDLASARAHFEEVLASDLQPHDLIDSGITEGYLALLSCEEGAYREAAAHLAAALSIWRDLNNQENLSEWLAEAAVLATAIGDPETAAQFLGTGIALRDTVGHAFVLPERAIFERTEQSLRDMLSPNVFTRAYRAGSEQPLDKTLDEASAFLARLLSTDDSARIPNPFGLTTRELDVLRLLAQGKTDRDIADVLYIGTRTVETHVSNLIAKLGVSNRTEAAALAIQNGLIDGHR